MVLSADGRLYAASTAAGPAFEGMNISCGMRAAVGAVEFFAVRSDAPHEPPEIRTIGEAPATGICGSGLLDIVGELAAYGGVESGGRFAKSHESPLGARLQKRDDKTVFVVQNEVTLSQKDIRQVQLAKAAVRAGIDLLLQQAGVRPEQVDAVLIAGSFGYHLRVRSLINIGLLPPEFADRIEFVGNTSKTGAESFLLDRETRSQMLRVIADVTPVNLGDLPEFEKIFVASIPFPPHAFVNQRPLPALETQG